MNELQSLLRERSRALLEVGKISCLIGWGAGRFPEATLPKFIFKPKQAEQLIYNEHCLHMLAKYCLSLQDLPGVVGLAARGCETRALNRMIADGCLSRARVYVLGLPCSGMREKGQKAAKCRQCRHQNPLFYDELLAPLLPAEPPPPSFAEIMELEKLPLQQRYDFWQGQFAKCIRCYACRNACPACNCRECFSAQGDWLGKEANSLENTLFGLTRAFHVGDRCVECGECQRACPMGLPLMLLSRKLIKDGAELFGSEEAGLSPETLPALATYSKDDPEEFS